MSTKSKIALGVWMVLFATGAQALSSDAPANAAEPSIDSLLDAPAVPEPAQVQSSVPAVNPSQPASNPQAVLPMVVAPSTNIPVGTQEVKSESATREEKKGAVGASSRIAEYQMNAAIEKAKVDYLSAKKERVQLEAEIDMGGGGGMAPTISLPGPQTDPSIPIPDVSVSPAKKDDFTVMGIFGSGVDARAKLARTIDDKPAGSPMVVERGDRVDGWMVVNVAEEGVRIRKGGKTRLIRYTN